MHKSLGKVNVIKHAMFDCEICLFRCPAAAGFSFNNCLAKHTFCRDCLKSYISVQIERNAVSVQCPGLRCLSKAVDIEIVPLVTKTEFAKLTLSRDKLDPSYRECGSCKQRMRFQGRSKMICACGITSCFLHGTSHLMTESCEAFVHRTEQEEAATANTIRTTTKKCPKCGVNTEKNGGCGHIKCTRCQSDWDWSNEVLYVLDNGQMVLDPAAMEMIQQRMRRMNVSNINA